MEELKEIREQLRTMNVNIEFIKDHMVDADVVLSEDDKMALKEFEKEKEADELVSLDDV